MKLLYFTDTHDKGRNPGARIDDYHGAIMKKFLEIEQVAINEKVDVVVHGGDWFDAPRVANSIINEHQRILRRIRKAGIKVYVVPGNHDLYGYSMSTIAQTSLGILSTSGLVTLLTSRKHHVLNDGKTSVAIHGREYFADIDKDPDNDYWITKDPNVDHNFLFAHGMLLEKPFHPDVRHTLTKDVDTEADMVVTGHYHDGYPTHDVNGTKFVNIGSTARDEGSKANLTRMPQYMIIDVNTTGYTLNVNVFASAQKGKDIFDRSQLEQKKQHVKYLEAFEQTIDDAIAYEAFDPKDILAKTKNIDQALLKEATDLIIEQEKAQQDSKLDGFIEKKKPIGIASVELENFQSHKKTKVELNDKGLNALTGASDSGKSAIIRCVRWVLYNEPKGSDFIRHGASRATGKVTFTDGSSITRSRTKSSAGEYIVRTHDGKEETFKGFGSAIPIDIANIHQMPKVELATGVERPINFSYQLDGHFLLSESPATRAATIGRLTGVHLVDGAIKEVGREIRHLTVDTNSSEKRIEELESSIASFTDLDETKRKIDLCQALFIRAEALERSLTELQELLEEYEDQTEGVKELKDALKSYSSIDKAEARLLRAEAELKELEELRLWNNQVRKARKEISEIKADLIDYENVDDSLRIIGNTEDLVREIQSLKDLQNDYYEANKEYELLKYELHLYEGISKIENLDHLEKAIREIKELELASDEYAGATSKVMDIESNLAIAKGDVEDVQYRMSALLKEMGTCPTCHQSLDEHAMEEILDHV